MSYPSHRTFRAPGRVNLIGEHTDYNDGFVMPVAIGFSTWIKLFPSSERKIEIYSENFNEQVVFDLDNPQTTARGHWSDYPIGVAAMFCVTVTIYAARDLSSKERCQSVLA
jgi:galactokinase